MSDRNRESQNFPVDINDIISEMLFSKTFLRHKRDNYVPNGTKLLNLLLFGKTGHGKSATGNSTLGRREFQTSSSVSSVTTEVKCSERVYNDYLINIIDTPGLADTKFMDARVEEIELVIENMENAILMSPTGINVFLFVVAFGNRFTEEDKCCLDTFRKIFGPRFLETNGVIVFTHGDIFEQSMDEEDTPDKSFDEWCREQRGVLGDLMVECSYRCVLFNNRQRDERAQERQIEQLIMLGKKCWNPYTHVHFKQHSDQRKKLIVELKLPEMKKIFQAEIDNLNLQINQGRFGIFGIYLVSQTLSQLEHRIAIEDAGTGLLNDMMKQLAVTRGLINSYEERRRIQRMIQQTASQDNDSGCSIL